MKSYAYVYGCITAIYVTKSPEALSLSHTYTLMHASITKLLLVLSLMFLFSRFEVGFDEIA